MNNELQSLLLQFFGAVWFDLKHGIDPRSSTFVPVLARRIDAILDDIRTGKAAP
jgi:hypothetical protein